MVQILPPSQENVLSRNRRIRSCPAFGHFTLILLDFSKAFNKVPHQRLIHKLNYYGIRDKKLNWITYFLGNRQVLLNGITSSKLSVDSDSICRIQFSVLFLIHDLLSGL